MILLLGETAAARELNKQLNKRGLAVARGLVHSEGPVPNPEADLAPRWQLVIDAAHPAQSSQFDPLRQWCQDQGIPWVRLERPETTLPDSPLIQAVFSWEDALAALQERSVKIRQRKGRMVTVFITSGSHQLDTIVQSPMAKSNRLVVRVLPEGRLVQKCQDLGILPRDIVAIQGPFSKELNRILFKSYGADIVFSRDSGPAGGTDTKIAAALALHLEVVLLRRPRLEAGFALNSVTEIVAWVDGILKGT